MTALLAVVAGMGVGLGLFSIVLGVAATEGRGEPSPVSPRRRGTRISLPQVSLARIATGIVGGVVMFLVTGWLVGAVLAVLAGGALPRVFDRRNEEVGEVERMQAVAAWAEMLRDTMAASAGLEEAIISTAAVAPDPVRPAVRRLAARLHRERLGPALHDLAAELDDPTADLVVTALSMAESRPARDLGALLGALAASARAEVSMRRRVHAGRARLRTAVRVVTLTTLGFAGSLILFNRDFLEPYDDALGQAWLLLVGAFFAGAVVTLQRMARIERAPRLFATQGSEPC